MKKSLIFTVSSLAMLSAVLPVSAYYEQNTNPSMSSGYIKTESTPQTYGNNSANINDFSDTPNQTTQYPRNSTQPYYNQTRTHGQYNYEQRDNLQSRNTFKSEDSSNSASQNNSNAVSDVQYRIERVLQNDSTLSSGARDTQIGVDNSGNVTLRGTVISDAEKKKIESIASHVSGVKSVTNKLSVAGSAFPKE